MCELNTSKDISEAILKLLKNRGEPMSTKEIEDQLNKENRTNPIKWPRIRNAIWGLTAANRAFLTWDWKVSSKPCPVEPELAH